MAMCQTGIPILKAMGDLFLDWQLYVSNGFHLSSIKETSGNRCKPRPRVQLEAN